MAGIVCRRMSAAIATALVATGCTTEPALRPADGHIRAEEGGLPAPSIPAPVMQSLTPPPPQPAPRTETYSVAVSKVDAQELLFALAREASLNVDIHPGITGSITLNAIDQTMPQLLSRIARQIDMRYELHGASLIVMPDTPFLRNYKIDYLNMTRDTAGVVTVTTEIGSPGPAAGAASVAQRGASASTSSVTRINNVARNRFWDTLIQNLIDILGGTAAALPISSSRSPTEAPAPVASGGDAATAPLTGATAAIPPDTRGAAGRRRGAREPAAVIANPETGVVTVRANSRQHERIQEFLDLVQDSARRQVLIEATVAEVHLSRNYQQGIEWSRLRPAGAGLRFIQAPAGALNSPSASIFELGYTSKSGSFTSAVRLLETFGTVKVLSSPKLSVMNNQTAVLKVVDNNVYFTISSNINQNESQSLTTFSTTVHSVPVGFLMNVTPQIGDDDSVLLNIRPTLSRIIGVAVDPNPALKKGVATGLTEDIVNEIPIIRSRELESMIRVRDGNVAVMGGLMEDVLDFKDDAVPGLSRIPVLGNLFVNRDDTKRKTELVIFLRPTVVREAGIAGDYRPMAGLLPGPVFFGENAGPPESRLDLKGVVR